MNADDAVHILYITYNRPHYTRLSLPRLLETCRSQDRVWIWHNGDHAETLEVAREHAGHPLVAKFHHSEENVLLRIPTNRFWECCDAPFLAKVDDDCLMPNGWIETLVRAHDSDPKLGILSAWPFIESDFREDIGGRKVRSFGGTQVMVNPWTGGSGYVMPRSVIDACSFIREGENFSGYCKRSAAAGFINGWLIPFVLMDHMDDPRSPNTGIRTEEDFQRFPGLSAQRFGMASFEELKAQTIQAALDVQQASPDICDYMGLRGWIRKKVCRLTTRGRKARFNA